MSVYCVSDLHGHLDLYKQIKDFLEPQDKVICLGDCGDRGPQPWETIKAVAADPQWEYLMGNHEHMLAGAMCEYLDDSRLSIFLKEYPTIPSMQALVAYNGGIETLNGWIDDGANPDWITFIMGLNNMAAYHNGQYQLSLTHAGFTPGDTKTTNFDILWSREHFFDAWEEGHDNEIIIHGHTPCQSLIRELSQGKQTWHPRDGAIQYAGTHKICIDMGTYVTGAALLLDLDTFDEHIFHTEIKED